MILENFMVAFQVCPNPTVPFHFGSPAHKGISHKFINMECHWNVNDILFCSSTFVAVFPTSLVAGPKGLFIGQSDREYFKGTRK